MASFDRASPALKEILLRIHSAEKPIEVDHHLYEFGSVEYHIKSSASDPRLTYLSISTPQLIQEVLPSHGLSPYTIQMVREISTDVLEIVEPAKDGYQITVRLDFSRIPRGKDKAKFVDQTKGSMSKKVKKAWGIDCLSMKFKEEIYYKSLLVYIQLKGLKHKDSLEVITEVSSIQAVILSSQLKEMLQNVKSWDTSQGMFKPIKLVYRPTEPFYVIRQPQKIVAVFPMRFKENSDVIIATSFFQELMDVGNSEKWAKAPTCSWSPIPPPELRGEPFKDLRTNGGFVSFDISSQHVEGKRLDKTVWSLLNFYAYVKHHVKCTRGFIQRRMRMRLEILVQLLQNSSLKEDGHIKKVQETAGWQRMKKLARLTSNSKVLKGRCHDFRRKIKRIRFRIKIHGFGRFRK